ncbi:hypothetical protein GCM10009665_05090 [Kitasatospora nipponensis]|uniref:WD40 repeat protein n=1 Tax=Kitasatospora nipponensis TaxID=258049 RepID=A0ABN1VNG3_9ACTN
MFGLGRSTVQTVAGVCAVTAALAAAGVAPAVAAPATATPATARQVCLAPGGAQPDQAVYPAAISADGRFALVDSSAGNLVPGGNNGNGGVLVCDLRTGHVERADLSDAGAQPDGFSSPGAISANGRYVVFTSSAGNLVPGTTQGVDNIYLRDLRTRHTELISVGTGGAPQVGGSAQPSISADGRYVAFNSNRSDLVPGDTNQASDAFVRDRRTGSTVRVSVHSDGTQGAAGSFWPSISADGSRVVFVSRDRDLATDVPTTASSPAASTDAAASDLAPHKARYYPLFTHDLRTGRTAVASVEPDGTTTADVTAGRISADGRSAVFTSLDNDYLAPSQVMVRDLDRGTTTLVSAAADGTAGNRSSSLLALSPDHRFAYFGSTADNLLPGGASDSLAFYRRDLRSGRSERLLELPLLPDGGAQGVGASVDAAGSVLLFGADGSTVLPGDTDHTAQAFTVRLGRR